MCGTFVSLQQTLIIPIIGDLPKLFHTTPSTASWLITATLLTSAVAMPTVSRLADMFGKRRMMVICLILIIVGSLLGAVGTSLPLVIIARALQGFSTALIPVGISIMRDELPKAKVPAAVALMSATLGIGGAIGLPLGGFLYAQSSYHALFWLSAAAGVVLLVAILKLVTESLIKTPGRFDVLGALIISIALTCFLLAVSKGGSWGWGSSSVLGLFAAFVVLLVLWVPYELKIREPLIDLRTSARRPVLITNIATVLIGFAMFGQMLAVTQLLTMPTSTGYGYGFTPMQAGLAMLPGGTLMVFLAPVSATITNRFGAKTTLVSGAVIMGLGYIGLVFMIGTLFTLILGTILVSAGLALAYAAMPTLIMRAVPMTETASANGLNALLRSVGTSSASAAVAAVLASMTMTAGGIAMPAVGAFKFIFWISAISALIGASVGAFLPKHRADLEESFDPGAEYDTNDIRKERAQHGGAVDTTHLVTIRATQRAKEKQEKEALSR
ncbi:MFS transporter [Antricoccus suffuscus]|uniref:MFS transporter n=1 Tax=Antricoccus suffuscus TaxID=1629062 RepID=A0A2T0ZZE5_9ACTN|nr:MFS transporter [Antricoccus suffuscus]